MTSSSAWRLSAPRPAIGVALVLVLLAGCAGTSPSAGQPAPKPPDRDASPTTVTGIAASGAALRSPPDSVRPNAGSLPRPLPDGGWPSTQSGLPSPAAMASPGASAPPAQRSSPAGTFALDLYGRGDFASQRHTDWCVPAAIQTMANIIARRGQASTPSQLTLNRRARALSSSRLVGVGSEPQGWAGILDELGSGRYVVVARPTFRSAMATAARAIRLTHRPVGLLVWRGAHAWVMSGFEATADPARTSAFAVIRVRVSDPWYPRPRGSWGRTRPPDSAIGMRALARVYLPWRRPFSRYAELDGRYVLVLPVAAG